MNQITIAEVYIIGVPIILAMIFIESVISSIQNKSLYSKQDTLCTIGLLSGNIGMSFAIKSATLAFHFYLYQFKLFDLVNLMPLWVAWVLTFILIDLVFYVYHRLSHKVRFLWAIHMSHHSSEEMNFAVSFRQAWFGPISKIPFFAVLPIIGLEPTMIAVAGVISTLWGVVGHTQIINKLGPLEWVFNTPSHHRVHHGSNAQYIDKNYGNLLIIWDRMFGTFEPEVSQVKFGLVNNVNTFNPVKITFMGWKSMLHELSESNNLSKRLKIIFGPPNTKHRSGIF